MADAVPRRARSVRPVLVLLLMIPVALALAWTKYQHDVSVDLSKNFVLNYSKPTGWSATAHGPETLFRYVDPKTHLVLRGAVNQVISETNPTPELDTEGIADYYVDRTENMKGWTVAKLGTFKGDGTQFEVLRRATRDRIVVTAYAVRGNTTVLVSLFGRGKTMSQVDPTMPWFNDFLSKMSLHQKDMSDL